MKTDAVHDVEKLYDQVLEFLQKEALTDKPISGPSLVARENNLQTVPEKYLLRDNLLLLLKEV